MTILYMDGFEHYGTGATSRTNIVQGAWSAVSTIFSIETTRFRTGARGVYRAAGNHSSSSEEVWRYSFPTGPLTTVGVSVSVFHGALPTVTGQTLIMQLRDNANAPQLTLTLNTTGQLILTRGQAYFSSAGVASLVGVVLATSAAPVVVGGSFIHYEMRAVMDNSVGAVEVRANGVTVISVTGVDTVATANVHAAQVAFGVFAIGGGAVNVTELAFDDFYVWDTNGSVNNNFIGMRGVYPLYPAANSTPQNWAATGGSAFATLAETAPNDATYISTATVSDKSQFTLTDLPTGVGNVSAVQIVSRELKTDAGTCSTQNFVSSSGVVGNGAAKAITTTATYYKDVIELDPNTSAAWTRTAVNALEVAITRTA